MIEWHTFWSDERLTCRFEFRGRAMAFLHLAIHKRVSGMRAARRHYADALRVLKAIGYRFVHVLIPAGDEMLYRFEQSFGFQEVTRRYAGHILMAREI